LCKRLSPGARAARERSEQEREVQGEAGARAARERSEQEREVQGEAVARAARERSEQERATTGDVTEGSANLRKSSAAALLQAADERSDLLADGSRMAHQEVIASRDRFELGVCPALGDLCRFGR